MVPRLHDCTGRPLLSTRFSALPRSRQVIAVKQSRCDVTRASGAHEWMLTAPLELVMEQAAVTRDARPNSAEIVTFSPKVFLPVTRLCRDTCGYCTFTQPPRPGQLAYMQPEEVLSTALAGQAAGCSEALITLGDKPELKYDAAAEQLRELGFETTIDYVAHLCNLILRHTELLPHVNAGVLTKAQLAQLRRVSVSQGLMLETSAPAVLSSGGAHYDCPDKDPQRRLDVLQHAGELAIPFTTGLLVGIGETPRDRLSDLEAILQIQQDHGHIQELIIQNFRAKPGTAMADHPEPCREEHLRTIAMARLIFGPNMNIQAPPNLSFDSDASPNKQSQSWQDILNAGATLGHQQHRRYPGANDFGGVSPVTLDWVNPASRWPHLSALSAACGACDKLLLPRLPVYPEHVQQAATWLDDTPLPHEHADTHAVVPGQSGGATLSALARTLACADAAGYARASGWYAGQTQPSDRSTSGPAEVLHNSKRPPPASANGGGARTPHIPQQAQRARWAVELGTDGALKGCGGPPVTPRVQAALDRVAEAHAGAGDGGANGHRDGAAAGIGVEDVEILLAARGQSAQAVVEQADTLRRRVCGDKVTYVVNRNINYTNVCTYGCKFCAFSKGRRAETARDEAYLLPLEEIQRRVAEAWDRGATEVCLQGGIHPEFTGHTYLEILRACKDAAPDIHVHAFSPLEVHHGASTLGEPVPRYLQRLREAGLGSLPGTAAEVLTEGVRRVICPDKLSVQEWLDVIAAAHGVGLRTTSTIMFGHVDGLRDWAEHLLALKELQQSTGGITEFVPLPFVHMEAPIYRKGKSRRGPTLHEAILLHAVARLVLFPEITNIQASWVKMGPRWAASLLNAGCNDMGGSIMNESITRAAGAGHGQELGPSEMQKLISSIERIPQQRTTLYGIAPEGQVEKSFDAAPLLPV